MTALWNACEHHLTQVRNLVGSMSPAQYAAPHAHCYGGSVGEHVRHCLEHFEGFRRGVTTGAIDYDARDRGTPEETDPDAAAARMDDLNDWFQRSGSNLANHGRVQVKIDCGWEEEPGFEESTVGRELQFLVSHTVHHLAIIGIMCEAQQIKLDPEFGVAPSTLRHRKGA